jgi:Tol biopolymer transport system component
VPYSIAGDGTLVYANGQPAVGKRTLVWVDRQGKEEPIAVPPRAYTYARLSPDGTRVALDSRDEQNDIWTFDLARGTLTQLTHDPGLNRGPAWTPDGKRLAFSATSTGVETAHWQAADGSGSMERLGPADRQLATGSFTPDMRQLVFMTPFNGPYDIGVLSIDTGEMRILLDSTASEENPEVSPDGSWLAYQSNESGEDQVYLRPFPDVTASRMQVSTTGGTRPLWSHDGKELFYFVPAAGNREAAIMAVPVTLGNEVKLGIPVSVVTGALAVPRNSGRHYDVSPDGKRFLLLKDMDNTARDHADIHLVLNWTESLERIVPRP